MMDFIIVGRGLSANVLMHRFHQHGLSFKTIGITTLSSSSLVAAGIWNPVVFKRLTGSWMADHLVPSLLEFYRDAEKQTAKKFITEREIIKPFTEYQEKIHWIKKAGTELSGFLDPEICYDAETLQGLKIKNGYGIVKRAGNLDVPSFIEHTASFFKDHIINEVFEYPELQVEQNHVIYKGSMAKNIVFCEGYLVSNNPWFNWLKLNPAKGETLTVDLPEIKLNSRIFNRDGFIMKTIGSHYKVGATYNWKEFNDHPTEEGKKELLQKLQAMTMSEGAIIDHKAGVRPSSVDRRPVIGRHPQHQNLFIFNGLGAKGVMLAPYFSEKFVLFYLKKEVLPHEVDVERFFPDYDRQKK